MFVVERPLPNLTLLEEHVHNIVQQRAPQASIVSCQNRGDLGKYVQSCVRRQLALLQLGAAARPAVLLLAVLRQHDVHQLLSAAQAVRTIGANSQAWGMSLVFMVAPDMAGLVTSITGMHMPVYYVPNKVLHGHAWMLRAHSAPQLRDPVMLAS